MDMNKLRWRCRRGTLELDLLLCRYLDLRHPMADMSEQQVFLDLLALEDTDLMRYLMGEQRPGHPELAALVELIRGLPALPALAEPSHFQAA